MTSVTLSQFKINPAAILAQAQDYPLSVTKHNQVQGYVVGKEIFEKLVAYVEDMEDSQALKTTDLQKGRDLEEIAKELDV
jgi:hypothetical protein